MDDDPEQEARTSVSIYHSDLAWLKRRQLKISEQRSQDKANWLPMYDILRELIREAQLTEEGGVVMVPLIENPEAFVQRTAELRAQGFEHEADARDRFVRRATR